jgi:hypothetical protein
VCRCVRSSNGDLADAYEQILAASSIQPTNMPDYAIGFAHRR